MSDPRIREALETHLAALLPALPTAWQGRDFDPETDAPDEAAYQEAFILPGPNRPVDLKQRRAINIGIFQVNLCYPLGLGAAEVEARARLLQVHFAPDSTVLYSGGVKVLITGRPVIGAPVPGRPGRYVVPVSIRFQSTF